MNPRSTELPDGPFAGALRAARQGRAAEAILAIERVLREHGAEGTAGAEGATALVHVARIAEATGDVSRARQAIAAALRVRPTWPDLLVQRARLALAGAGATSREARTEARKALDAALAANPDYLDARLERALLDASEGLIGEALERLRGLATESRIREPHAFEQGLESLARADWEEAAALFHRALPPADVHDTLERVRALMDRGDDPAAVQLLRQSVSAHASYPDLHLLLGSAEFRRGHLDDALVCLARALELNPDFHAARVQLARVLEALGQSAQAAEQVALVLEHDPSNPVAGELSERWRSRGRRPGRDSTTRNRS